MGEITKGYVYDKSGRFWDKVFSPVQLKEMDDSMHPDIRYIRHNLYYKKDHSENYRLIFVNSEKPHFRRWNISDAERYGFSSVCETKLHKACKLGISNAERLRIRINGKDYTIIRNWSDTETIYQLLGNKYETDCEYEIANIDSDLQDLLGGDVLFFEIHHKSKVKSEKVMAYRICGFNILEFNIETQYISYNMRNERLCEEEMIQYFTDYYENVDKHYITGTFFTPIISDIEWYGGKTKVFDKNGEVIEIKIYRDRFSKEKCYNIIFICNGKKFTQFMFDGKRIKDFNDAKLYANYLIKMHLSGEMKIAFS